MDQRSKWETWSLGSILQVVGLRKEFLNKISFAQKYKANDWQVEPHKTENLHLN